MSSVASTDGMVADIVGGFCVGKLDVVFGSL